ncbi:MAG: hypothetical protein ACE15F_03695 [bacterium]
MNNRHESFSAAEIQLPGWKHRVQNCFARTVEILLVSGVLLLSILVFYPSFERCQLRSQLTDSRKNLQNIVEALLIYSSDHPGHRAFPPKSTPMNPGIALCPILPPEPGNLAFLTSPVPYLPTMVRDPFLTRMAEDSIQTPFILHWIKSGAISIANRDSFIHLGWGAFTVGPSLALPASYDIAIFQWVPYDIRPLRYIYFNPTNGLHSGGFVYTDSLGNSSPL